MKIGKIRYQSVVFGDFKEITPSSNMVMTLLELYKEKNFIPNTFVELNQFSPTLINRIALSSENNEWLINLGSQRIDIFHNSLTIGGENLGTIDSFVNEVLGLLRLFLSKFNKKGNRISLVAEAFIDDETKNSYDKLYRKLRNPFGVYAENIPLEWNIRDAIRKKIEKPEYEETFNVISSLGRAKGRILLKNELIDTDRVNFLFDINTIPENVDHRFDIDCIKWGLTEMVAVYNSLIADVKGWIE